MKKIRISAVSYLNTFPFVYGLMNSGDQERFDLQLDVPSVCAEKLRSGDADIALVPVGALPGIGQYHVASGFCIGAVREVKTVLLLSHQPVDRIRRISLDADSRTSVELIRVLAQRFWKVTPEFSKLAPGGVGDLDPAEAVVAIGDKTFGMRARYPYVYDLAAEWIRFTGLPFVFAIWISRRPLPADDELVFCSALRFGVDHIPECLDFFRDRLPACEDCRSYLEENISYTLDDVKLQGMQKFLDFLG
jgi:chorismate dehydratase